MLLTLLAPQGASPPPPPPPPPTPQARRRRGVAEVYYPPRRQIEREDTAALPEPAPPQAVPEVRPIIPGAAKPVRVVARDLRDLGRVLGLDAASLDRARRQAEIEEDDEEVLLLL